MLYRRHVNDIFKQRKKNFEDILFKVLNNYDKKRKLIIEMSLTKFLDIKLIFIDGIYKTMLHGKLTKLPTHWSLKVPKH